MTNIIPVVERSTDYLHPLARPSFIMLAAQLRKDFDDGISEFEFRIFETYRSPVRQEYVTRQGNSKAQAFRSAHQYGLAVDFVPFIVSRGFVWDVPGSAWDHLRRRAHEGGFLNDIPWDRAHVEFALWKEIQALTLLWKPKKTAAEGRFAA